jgi:hypothetical protein
MKQKLIAFGVVLGGLVGTVMIAVGLAGFLMDAALWGMPIIFGMVVLGGSVATAMEMKP